MGAPVTMRRLRTFRQSAENPSELARRLDEFERNAAQAVDGLALGYQERLSVVAREDALNSRILRPGQIIGITEEVARVTLDAPKPGDSGKLTGVYRSSLTPNFVSVQTRSPALIEGRSETVVYGPGLTLFANDGVNYWPTEPRKSFDVTIYGASPRATGAKNRAAFQEAMDAAHAVWLTTGVVQTVHVPVGLFKLELDSASWWTMPLNGSTTEFHGAVALRSGVTVEFEPGAQVVPVAPAGANASWYYGIFASEDIFTTVGDLEQVRFIRPSFEFGAANWDSSLPLVFGIMAVGVYDLSIEGGRASNADANTAGRFARLMNCELWRAECTTVDVVQSLYLSYLRQGSFAVNATGFTEAVDIDQSCWLISGKVKATAMRASSEGQVLDISSVQDGNFEIECDDVGNAFILYPKPECWEDFSDWVTNFPLGSAGWSTDPVMCKRVSINVKGHDVHHPTELRCFQVALDRTDAGWGGYWDGKGPMCEDVTIRADFQDTDGALVYECKNIDLVARLTDVTTGNTARVNNAALTLRAARTGATALAESELSGRVQFYVKNSTRTGVRISKPTDLYVTGEVDGYNSADDAGTGVASGVWIEDLARMATVEAITLGPIHCKNGDLTVDPTDLRLTWDGGAQPTYVRDLGGHKLTTAGTQPMRVALFGYFPDSTNATVAYDTVAAATVDVQIGIVTAPGARLAAASIVTPAAIVGNAVDFSDLSIRHMRAGVVSGAIGTAQNYDDVNRAAGESVELGIDGTDTDGVLQAGDILVLRAVRHGAGSIQAGLWVRFHLVEYAI